MISERLFTAAAARLNSCRARHMPTENMAPLGLASALLLFAFILVADNQVDPIGPASSPQSRLNSDLQRALATVRASMIELPSETEVAAIAQLAASTQKVLLENRELFTELRALRADYTELKDQQRSAFDELQNNVDQIQDDIRVIGTQQEELESLVHMVLTQRRAIYIDAMRAQSSPHNKALGPEFEEHQISALMPEASADANDVTISNNSLHSESSRSPLTGSNMSTTQTVEIIAFQIAEGLKNARREAISSGQERAFTFDIDRRIFIAGPASEPVPLDHNLHLSLYTAKAELIGPKSGRIRFFPDGSSTGGRISLDLHGRKARVDVDWSTGSVSVEV